MSSQNPPDEDLPPKEAEWADEEADEPDLDWNTPVPSPATAPEEPSWLEGNEDEDSEDTPWFDPVQVGWMERSALPEWGVQDLKTWCATGRETSSLHGDMRQVAPGRISLSLGQGDLDLPLVHDSDELMVELVVQLAGVRFPVQLTLVATSGPPHLVLGRDALAGRFLVDPSRSWVGSST